METSQLFTTHFENNHNIHANSVGNSAEKEVIAGIYKRLSAIKMRVSQKDIILVLLENLETERDFQKQDIYRKALEIVIHRPGDETEA